MSSENPKSTHNIKIKNNSLTFTPKRVISKKANRPNKNKKRKSKKLPTQINKKRKNNPASLASRLLGTNQQMLRAVLPNRVMDPGIAKPNFHDIATWLKNIEKLGILDSQRIDLFFQKVEKVQNYIMKDKSCKEALAIFYSKLATTTAYGEDGVSKMMTILDEYLMNFDI